MLYISDNLKCLRTKKNQSQREAAEAMGMPRDRYRKYEDGTNTPPAEMLVTMSRYYHVSIDLLLTVDLRKVDTSHLIQLEDNRIVLPITVDAEGNNLIEVVTQKAKAGYLNGYADYEYISNLPQISLPFLGTGKHRGFPVQGDSMPPHQDGDIIVVRYVESLGEIVDGKTYIIITKEDGIVYKRLNKNGKNVLMAHSDNSFYPSFQIKASDVVEVWEYECSIGRSDKKFASEETNLKDLVLELRNDVREMKQRFKG